MKINFPNNFAILVDLHDTLVFSKRAWKKAFKIYLKNDKEKYKKLIHNLTNGWKRKICEDNNIDYEKVKEIHLTKLKPMKNIIKLCNDLKKDSKVYLVTNARKSRAEEDLKSVNANLTFDKMYTRENGIKPNEEYMRGILKDNNIQFAIMIGNEKEKDVFNSISSIKTILIKPYMSKFIIKLMIKKIIKKNNREFAK